MTLLKIIIYATVFIVGITFFTLYQNGANLFEEPGAGERLQVFLTANSARTEADHKFKELRTPEFDMDAEQLYKRVLKAAAELGWEVVKHDSDNQNANFVVYSPVLLFEDDVFVQVSYLDGNRSSLFIESSSRAGKADLAANSGHIQALIKKLKH